MSNEIEIFNYNNSQVRTVQREGEPWFVLKDVCGVLGISNHKMTAQRLDRDEVSQTYLTDSIGRQQETTIINESGLYNVLIRSDKPVAKPFRKWVTSEVLPSIRKHGLYATEDLIANPDLAIAAFTALKEEREKRKALESVVEVQGNQLEEQKPLVEFANRVSNTDRLISVGEMAKLLKDKGFNVGRNKFFEYLRGNKILMGNNVPYQKYIDAGYFQVRETSNRNGGVFLTTYVTGKGQMYLVDKVTNLSK